MRQTNTLTLATQELQALQLRTARATLFRELHQAILQKTLRQIRQQYPHLTDNQFNSLFS